MNAKLLGAGEWQTPWKKKNALYRRKFSIVSLSLKSSTWMRTHSEWKRGKIQPLKHRLEEENISRSISQNHSHSETQTDLSSYLQTLCLLFTNTRHYETNIILKETLDMLCICKFDFIGIAVK